MMKWLIARLVFCIQLNEHQYEIIWRQKQPETSIFLIQ
jgi:hypothetical protein